MRIPLRFLRAAAASCLWAGLAWGQPVNYDESLVGNYILPNPLILNDGTPVTHPRLWIGKRRGEILAKFEQNQFGKSPAGPPLNYDLFDPGTSAINGKALRKQVTIFFSPDPLGPKMELLLYLPSQAVEPVGLLLNLSFLANQNRIDDPGIKPGWVWQQGQKVPASNQAPVFLDIEPLLDAGFGFATVYYGDIDPDFVTGIPFGVRHLYGQTTDAARGPDEWGAIGAWAWGLSRAIDYLETDPGVHPKRIGLIGHSRLGKTVLWAGASDKRVHMVIASCSGEGGASLSRRWYGETVKHLNNVFPYWFARRYLQFGNAVPKLPVDSHMLISLMAPRPVLLTTGDTDLWADPKGEFLALQAASPVYELLGEPGINSATWPAAGQPVLGTLGYAMHAGGHGQFPEDWAVYLQFLQMHLVPPLP